MDRRLKIIHIEDVPTDAELVDWTLKKSGIEFEKIIVDTREEYIAALEQFGADIILSDHSLPNFNSLEALKLMHQRGLDIPFILITATVSEEFAVNVMKEGASDYVLKDRLQRLPNAIGNALAKYESDADRQHYLNQIVSSEALFQKAESIAGFGTWRYNMASGDMHWSGGMYPLMGYAARNVDVSVKSFTRNVHPDNIADIEYMFSDAGNTAIGETDFKVINEDGHVSHIHCQFEIELNESGKPEYLAGFIQDVTRSKLAQLEIQKNLDEIQAAADRQSGILNALQPHVVLLNESGKIIAVNESWKKFTIKTNLGVPKYGIDYSYFVIAEKATGADEQSVKQLITGIREVITGVANEFSLEYSFYEKKKRVWYQIIVAPLRDKMKKGAVVAHVNITERKQAEEALQQSEANLRSIFDNTDVAYVLCNAENKVISFNAKASDLCAQQFDKKLKVGGNAFSYFPKNKIPNLKEAIRRIAANGMVTYETNYDLPGKPSKWYEVRWAGVADERKKNIGFILAFKDITDRKTIELERERMTADLVQRYKDLEQFTYIVSHNLRAPVANIMGLSNILSTFEFAFSEREDVLKALSTSIGILDQIIIDLNQILQVHSNMNERTERISFAAIVEEIRYSLANLIKREDARIETNFGAVESMVAIKGYLYSIFYNLISNSIKYRRKDVTPEISVITRQRGKKLEIIFRDNGKGIEEGNLKNLFGLYKRFDTSVEGKGLGLFMVKMQVENLDGKISVQSTPGAGTTFKLEFPAI